MYFLNYCLFWSFESNSGGAETTKKHKDDSHKQTQDSDSVAPLSSVTAKSTVTGKEDVKPPLKNQGTVQYYLVVPI